ncbi:uncharacterized protein PV09_02574 [Verruconis gallopava]|uniref:SRR1-like domain-containing protein n=1 Tax=Verruconis gallopava TaxID=253628 RepID=A0A0D2B6P1_9PEZI|nr:uncharacterized protein PV09_02574 [Verruconis gallopava]KIW06904.1 hypothetical protein PV09_02574 [Verruconis gallopava]
MPRRTMNDSDDVPSPSSRTSRKDKTRLASKELQQLLTSFDEIRSKYETSEISRSIEKLLKNVSKTTGPPTRVLSLGLGSFGPIKSRTRRLKQLAIFLGIATTLQWITNAPIALFAQDPTFSRFDEAFLATFGIAVVRTPSGSELGEAEHLVDESTLIYSPFLTLEAYQSLLLRSVRCVKYLVGDDFNSLLLKWPKHSAERDQVEKLIKMSISRSRRREIRGDGFWNEEDKTFPMAMYSFENRLQKIAKA